MGPAFHAAMYFYPKHLENVSYRGGRRYFLTLCTHQRAPHFADERRVALVATYVLSTVCDCQFADLAHCFMPDHLHMAIEGRAESADAKRLISRMKQASGYHFQKEFGCRLWQRYTYERIIRSSESTRGVLRYILENPLRAGLARTVDEYPYIGSSEYSREELVAACTLISG